MLPRIITDLLLTLWILTAVAGGKLIRVPPALKIISDKGDDVKFVCKVNIPPHLKTENIRVKWKHKASYIDLNKRSDKYRLENTDMTKTLLISRVDGSDAGVYACVVSVDGITKDIEKGRLVVRMPPEAPLDVSMVSCQGNEAELNWRPGNDGGADITSYLVQFNTSENPMHWNYYYEDIPVKDQTARISLSPWGTYSFRMLAKNRVGYSEPSLPTKIVCTTPPDHPGGNPKDVRTLTHKKGKLIITWTPMPRLLHNGPGFKYVISWREKGGTYWNKNIVEDFNAKTWEVAVNRTYKEYEIKVKAENDIGESYQPAFVYSGHSGEGEPEEIPKDFRVDLTKAIEPHKVHFIWESVDTATDNIRGQFRGYKLRYWKSSEGRHKWKEVDVLMHKSSHTRPEVRTAVEGLPAFTALRAQVSVMNTHYTGPPSQIIDFSTPEGVPGPVRNLHSETQGAMYALLQWLPPDEPNGLLQGYDIAYQTIKGSKKGPIKALPTEIENPTILGARITGLLSDHKYRFYVWARTKAGRGEPVHLDVRTKDGDTSDKAQPFGYTKLDQTSVNITWTSFQLRGDYYVLEYRPTGNGQWEVAIPERGRSWMVLSNLVPNTEYEVRVIAKNEFGDTAGSTRYRVKIQPSGGRDSHMYQTGGENSGTSLNQCSRTSLLIVQTIVTLTSIVLIFH